MPERQVAGKSIVTRRAIVAIVRTAVQSSYGVTGFADPSLGRRVLRWAGLDQPGIQLTTRGGLGLDLYIKVAFGVPVAEVARQVDSAVRYSLRKMAGIDVASLTVHVDGLGYQPTAVQRAEAIEREIEGDAADAILIPQGPAEVPERNQAHKVTAAGATAGKRRKSR